MFDLFTGVELLIMGSIVGFLVLVVMILVISEIFSRKKEMNLLLEKNDEVEIEVEEDELYKTLNNLYLEATGKFEKIVDLDAKEEIKTVVEEIKVENKVEITEIEVEKNKEENLEIKDSEIISITPNVLDDLIIEDLDPVVVKVETEDMKDLNAKEKAQIELLKIEQELEHALSLEDTITNLEAIEEENAIISYQELLSNTSELEVVTCDSGDEPITISEVFKMFNDETDEGLKITEELSSVPLSEAYQGNFKETPYLSPITGLEVESLSEIQLENTANLEKLDREIRKTNEFLNILNELKKNLE